MKKFSFLLFIIFTYVAHTQSQFPEWAKGIVWYQIFPERFCNGDTTNDPDADKVFANTFNVPKNWKVTPWTSDWFAQADWEKEIPGSFSHKLGMRRYGGDIQGIINKLEYIKSLGIGGIYLNPMFEAVSLHKYDGSSYHHIDINFGPDPAGDKKLIESEIPDKPETWKWTSADKLFLKLVTQAHKLGIKIIIDGVFNHTGVQFWAFQDIVRKGKASAYYEWYQIRQLDDPATPENEFDYKGWWNSKSLPEFNRTKENLYPAVKDYILNATRRWLAPIIEGTPSEGIDGWRLDVARDVPLGFWKEWRSVVKSANPQAIIVGELWELSPDFIGPNGVFDALMNYNFAYAVNDFFIAQDKKILADTLINRLRQIDRTYPEQNLYVLQNLLTSHDTERLSSMIANPDRQYDRDGNEGNPKYNPGKPKPEHYELQKLIAAFQMTYRGSPMIYYGDEVGMWGADDPHDRKPMIWNELDYDNEVITPASGFGDGLGTYKVNQDKELLKFYKKMIAIRNFYPALKFGSVEFLPVDENHHVFGFTRTYQDEKILVVFNLSDQSEIFDLPVGKNEVVDINVGDKVKLETPNLRIVLWGKSFAIYKI